jgi:hypothetical protein
MSSGRSRPAQSTPATQSGGNTSSTPVGAESASATRGQRASLNTKPGQREQLRNLVRGAGEKIDRMFAKGAPRIAREVVRQATKARLTRDRLAAAKVVLDWVLRPRRDRARFQLVEQQNLYTPRLDIPLEAEVPP